LPICQAAPYLGVGGSQTLLQVSVVRSQPDQLAEMERGGEPIAHLLGGSGNLRNASAVLFFQGGRWRTKGKTVFNLNPDEALARFANQ
jgi:hypothetical protein